MNAPAPGWHPDPTRRHHYRYWDGDRWTDDVADGGITSLDPIGGPPRGDAGAATLVDVTAPAGPGAPAAGTAPVDPTLLHHAPPAAPSQQPPAGPRRRRPPGAVIAAIGVVAVALVGGLVYLVTRDDGDDPADDPTEVADEDPTSSDPGGTSDTTESDDSGTGEEIPPLPGRDGENRDELVEFMADQMAQASGGVLDHDEAVCISEGLLDELGVAGLVDIGQAGENPFDDPELGSQLAGVMEDCGISLEDLVASG